MVESIPHGGQLINRFNPHLPIDRSLNVIEMDPLELSDLELLANGAYSPLQGFMGSTDYDSVVSHMRLSNGLPWSIPVTLAIDQEKANDIEIGEKMNLTHKGTVYGMVEVEEIYTPDKKL